MAYMNFSGVLYLDFLSMTLLDFDGNGIKVLRGTEFPRVVLGPLSGFRGPIHSGYRDRLSLHIPSAFLDKGIKHDCCLGSLTRPRLRRCLGSFGCGRAKRSAPGALVHVEFLFGFRPLVNPTVRVRARPVASSRVDLDLSVGGDPTEMKLSENISGDVKDKWVPYQKAYTVTLTPSTGRR